MTFQHYIPNCRHSVKMCCIDQMQFTFPHRAGLFPITFLTGGCISLHTNPSSIKEFIKYPWIHFLGFYNKIPQTGWIKNKRSLWSYSSGGQKCKIKEILPPLSSTGCCQQALAFLGIPWHFLACSHHTLSSASVTTWCSPHVPLVSYGILSICLCVYVPKFPSSILQIPVLGDQGLT